MGIAGVNLGRYVAMIGGEALFLRRYVEGAANADPNAGNARTAQDRKCRGYPHGMGSERFKGRTIRTGTIAFGIYGNSLPIGVRPVVGDRIVRGGVEHEIYEVPPDEQDSQGAVWVVYTTAVTP